MVIMADMILKFVSVLVTGLHFEVRGTRAMVTDHQAIVAWIEISNYELQGLFERLGYVDKHHLASHIIRTAPQVTKGDNCND